MHVGSRTLVLMGRQAKSVSAQFGRGFELKKQSGVFEEASSHLTQSKDREVAVGR